MGSKTRIKQLKREGRKSSSSILPSSSNSSYQHHKPINAHIQRVWSNRSHQRMSSKSDKLKSIPLSIGAVNINGMTAHSAWAVQRYLDMKKYDIFAVSETHFRDGLIQERFEYSGYKSWYSERGSNNRSGGGLAIYYREGLSAHSFKPKVTDELAHLDKERQWLLVSSGGKKVAFLHCYIACQSPNHDFLQWNSDLFGFMIQEANLLKDMGFTIVALGDFNSHVGRINGMEQNKPGTNANSTFF